jgi:hypothetical protein
VEVVGWHRVEVDLMPISVRLLLLTGVLVIIGCLLYLNDSVGWAQMMWVLASGTAGGTVLAIMDDR